MYLQLRQLVKEVPLKMTNNQKACADKKFRRKIFTRWLLQGETGWNYEKMQGSGYCYSVMPALKNIYEGDEDALQGAVKNHLQFFNTNPMTANAILGVNLAIEEELKTAGKDVVASVKTGLMGPLAGLGDSVFGVIIGTVFGAIAANMAIEGNPTGMFIMIAFNMFAVLPVKYFMFELGYKEGTDVVKIIGDKMKNLIDSANILGLTVVGALIPTVVSIKIPAVLKLGDMNMAVQADMLDKIMPNLLPVLLVAFVYWLLSRKGMTSTKAILLIMVLAIACSFFGIL